jgi:hypothetical protein
MRRIVSAGAALSIALITAVLAIAAFRGGSSAAPDDDSGLVRRPRASLVAITIGQLSEDGGEAATVDLHASVRDGRAGGSLRFYSEEYGYYNGGVRTVRFEDGVITAAGGGGLFLPDGTRVQVRYTATISVADETVGIEVKGKDGLQYTIAGEIEDGFVWAGDPNTEGVGD